jgi:hypothetical protein
VKTTSGGGRTRRWLASGTVLGVVGAALSLAGALGVGQPGGPAPGIKPELARVVGLAGALSQEQIDGVTRPVFRSQDKRWSAVLLENQIAEALQERVQASLRPPAVTVTGMVTEYRGRNYLLLIAATVLPLAEGG